MHSLFKSPHKTGQILFVLFIVSILVGCSSKKSLTVVGRFRFNMDDRSYLIKSISANDNDKSYNELIGKNFVAKDFDQDKVIDQIVIGECRLAKAQEIYEYGLNILLQNGKLRVLRVSTSDYLLVNSDCNYQIKSFHSKDSAPFNEFKITGTNKFKDMEIILIDQKADGTLDEVLKGTALKSSDYQERYSYVINKGLESDKLIKKGDMILVSDK